MSAMALPIMVGATGLALDSVQWMLWQRQLQQVADASAIAGAYAWGNGDPVETAARFALEDDEHIAFKVLPTVTTAVVGTQRQVTVSVSAERALPFSGLFMSAPPVLSTRATAALINDGEFCVLSLGRYNSTGITGQGNAEVELGCGMASNAEGDNSISAGGSASLSAEPFLAVGGIVGGTHLVSETPPQPYSLPLKDPYASRPDPVLPSCPATINSFSPKKNETVPLPGGVMCFPGGLSFSGQGTVELSPGVYYVAGGQLSFGSQVTVTGEGVVFVLTSATVETNPGSVATLNISAGAELDLSAPDSGDYKNIIFYQDRRAEAGIVNTINGHASLALDGAIYFPKQHLNYSGGSGAGTKCVQIVADSITFTGNSSITNDCSGTDRNFFGMMVRLVA